MVRVLLVGPTSMPWAEVREEVETDLRRLRAPGVDVSYRCTGGGPASIRSKQDALDAAPHVVRSVMQAATDGFDAVIVDCVEDPGVAESRRVVSIPVIGAGEALEAAIEEAVEPVRVLQGAELRTLTLDELRAEVNEARTVVLGGTGHSHLIELLSAERELTVIDPLDAALGICLAVLNRVPFAADERAI